MVLAAYTGVFPIAPTPFTAAQDLDLDGQRRVLDCMIDQGVDGICILANYSEQFLLSDDERNALLDVCVTHIAGRVPVIVTCSHFSTRIAEERSRMAAAAGAAMLMLMPPYHGTGLRADETGMLQHFARIAEAVSIPIMVQDAPLSGVALSVAFLVRLALEVPAVRYFKIEVPGAAAKLRSLIEAGGDAIQPIGYDPAKARSLCLTMVAEPLGWPIGEGLPTRSRATLRSRRRSGWAPGGTAARTGVESNPQSEAPGFRFWRRTFLKPIRIR